MFYVWIAFENRCKDIYLPDNPNWTGEVTLGQTETGLKEDLLIHFRTLDGRWYFSCPKGFSWKNAPVKRGELEIVDQLGVLMEKENYTIGFHFSRCGVQNTVFKKFLLPRNGHIQIGRDPSSDICIPGNMISARHASLNVSNGGCEFTDSSSQGSYINGVRLSGTYKLHFGDIISLPAGVKLVYLKDIIAIDSMESISRNTLAQAHLNLPEIKRSEDDPEPPSPVVFYHRTIRILEQPDETTVTIEAPPAKNAQKEQPFWMTIGPSMTMVLPMSVGILASGRAASSLAMVGTSAILSVFWATVNSRYKKKSEAETESKRVGLYNKYIDELNTQLHDHNEKEYHRLMNSYPDIKECARFPMDNSRRLWERMPTHSDFLSVRIGRGNVPSPGAITTQEQRLSLIDDPLRDEPRKLIDAYSTIPNAPVSLSLLENPMVAVLGSENVVAFTKGIVMQIASLHSYHDVHICILTEEGSSSEWEWAKWLPHVFPSEDRLLRMVVSTESARQAVLTYLDEVLSMRSEAYSESRSGKDDENEKPNSGVLPHFVVVCTNPELLENKPLIRSILQCPLGFTLIMLARSLESLPKECQVLLDTDGGYLLNTNGDSTKVDFEYPNNELLVDFSKGIAPIRVKASAEDAAIPSLVTFLEIYHVQRVEQLDVWRFWNENKAYDGLKSIVGYRSGSQPFILDISDKAHGPHGLVAGTTGSGKSVMLETYILSLALNYSPDQIRFILIDYKGGGMADTFKNLPHVTGIIDNLQGERIISRALASIQGEIHRRERIFRDAGVNKIDDYIRFFGDDPNEEKLPHLIIIVDEFAELKNEQPDFMRELISASRVGRSLGVHLILATQKPSNSVSDEIWANTNFRICLRVQNRGDSMDMLHRPDAAYIKGMGRCFIQIGNDEIFEQVQTSFSGAAYKPDEPNSEEIPQLLDGAGQVIKIKKKKKKTNEREYTQMNAVLDLIDKTAKAHNMQERHMLWLAELKDRIFLSEIPGFLERCYSDGKWKDQPEGLQFPFALADDVSNQRYIVASVDLVASRNLIIAGLAGTGKTTLVQTMVSALARIYAPDRVQMYIMSLSSRTLGCLSAFPHVGDIVYEGETHELCRMITLLENECEARGKLFEAAWTNNFIEYNRSMKLKNEAGVPSVVVFIDRMAQLREMLEDNEDMLNRIYDLIREGSSRGIYFVVTSLGGNEVPMKLRDCFSGIALQLRERGDYSDALGVRVPAEMAAVAPITGRGMAVVNELPYEIQAGLPAEADTDVERAQMLTTLGKEMRAAWNGNTARRIARIPEKPSFEDFSSVPEFRDMLSRPLEFPLAYDLDSGLPMGIDLQNDFSYMIIGGRKSGKTNALMHIALGFKARGADVFVLGEDEWNSFCAENGFTLLRAGTDQWTEFMADLVPKYIAPRNTLRKTAQNKEQTGRIAASHKPFVFLADNFDNYTDVTARNHIGAKDITLLGQLFSQAANFGMYSFITMNTANIRSRVMNEAVKSMVDQQRGIALGGKLGDVDPWGVSAPFRQKNVSLPIGTAFYVSGEVFKQIVIPLVVEE